MTLDQGLTVRPTIRFVEGGHERRPTGARVDGARARDEFTEAAPVAGRARERSSVAEARVVVEAAYTSMAGDLFGFAYHATRDREAAEDIVHESFLRLFRELTTHGSIDSERGWLFRVAANLAISRRRRVDTFTRWFRAVRPDEPEASPERTVINRDRARRVEEALATLKPDARTALLLAARGFSRAEIGEAIGRSELATRTLLCRARMQVRRLVGEDD